MLIEGGSTAFVIGVSGHTTGNTSPSSTVQSSSERYLKVPIGHVYTQGYFHKYVAFSSFDVAETRFVTINIHDDNNAIDSNTPDNEHAYDTFTRVVSHFISLYNHTPLIISNTALAWTGSLPSARVYARPSGTETKTFGSRRSLSYR